ncbi:glycosyltransferase [Lacticaseibacillus thailandensis]|nr:glycosyltransferase [Lacticaseibacillus thailandensis]
MFPEYHKGIYLDADLVVTTDVARLYRLDLQGNYLGGCMDTYLADSPVTVAYVEDAVGVPMQSYINSGVLLMDLDALRACNLGDRFLALLQQYDFDTIAPDQDYINAMVHDHILRLDQTWNTMPTLPTMNQDLARPHVIHFNLFAKPWHYDHVMYADFFWQYVPDSGYADEVALAKRNYTQDDVATDDANAEALVDKATVLVASPDNFKRTAARGVQVRL